MRSMRPPKRSPSIAISDAPPGTLAKMPVVLSSRASLANATPEMYPRAMANKAPITSSHHRSPTCRMTYGVK